LTSIWWSGAIAVSFSLLCALHARDRDAADDPPITGERSMSEVQPPPAATPVPHTEGPQTFNNDLLVNDADQTWAKAHYPTLAPFLIFPRLHEVFLKYDHDANAAKKKGWRFGLIAILLGLLALLAASAAPLLHGHIPVWIEHALAIAAAVAGILGVLLAFFGGLHSGAKRTWLLNRLMTERIRQFHLQSLALHAVELARTMGNTATMRGLLEKRQRWFEGFRQHYEGRLPSRLAAVLDDEAGEETWTLDDPPADAAPLAPAEAANLELVFDAYRRLRFEHQIGYCDYKLRHPGGITIKSPRSLAATFGVVAFVCIGGTLLIHLAVAGIVAGGILKDIEPVLHVGAVWFALFALGVRAFEEGLRPRHEIERYMRYRADMKKLRDRFLAAPDVVGKLAAMHEAEEVSYEEMRDFLRTHQEALFVL
jgi:hypothetical protein